MALPRDIVAGLTRRLAERAGLELPAWVVEARATARMEALGVSAAEYVELVSTPRGRVELDELVEAVRVGETRFFRHVSQVEALVDVVAPAIAARGRRNVRVWSAGCASGEEAYTLAIVMSRVLPEHSVTVVATDVSEDALAVAARGRYPRAALGHVPEEWRDAFEHVDADEIRVRPEIAKRVTFEQANLVEGDAPRGCQVAWCRNVLIYFASEARKRAVQKLVGALETGGWLFVGYSEQLRDVVELEAVRAGDVTIYVKRGTGSSLPTRTPVVGIPIQSQPSSRSTTPMPTLVKPEPPSSPSGVGVRRVVATGDCGGLGREIGEALKGAGLKQVEIDLDGAEVVPDEVAVTLRRAKAAAEAAGVVLVLRATRAGVKRWLRRVGLEESP
ncbi:MAG TPA: protein-glutamate O-methyltransferase CheR [Kofleriaceae bacterium]|nr:protein-glutamate O-methyltransferase CheR [Kofleriaceae bacterium]